MTVRNYEHSNGLDAMNDPKLAVFCILPENFSKFTNAIELCMICMINALAEQPIRSVSLVTITKCEQLMRTTTFTQRIESHNANIIISGEKRNKPNDKIIKSFRQKQNELLYHFRINIWFIFFFIFPFPMFFHFLCFSIPHETDNFCPYHSD